MKHIIEAFKIYPYTRIDGIKVLFIGSAYPISLAIAIIYNFA